MALSIEEYLRHILDEADFLARQVALLDPILFGTMNPQNVHSSGALK